MKVNPLRDGYNESDFELIVDILEMKTGNVIFKKNDNELWDKWKKYVIDLEREGYFDDVKNEEWFIKELNNN